MDLIKKLWRGDVALSTTFWLFGVGVHVLLAITFSYLERQPDILTTEVGKTVYLLLALVAITYGPFILIAIWRSANKYQGLQRYAIAAKFMVIFAGANTSRLLRLVTRR